MTARIATVRTCAMVLLLVLLAGCDGGSPTSPRTNSMLGNWEATQSIAVPECNVEFMQTLSVEIQPGLGTSEVVGQVTYPGLGSCSLWGHVSGTAVEMESYRCFPFGYACDGQPAVCTGGRHLSLCHIATWSSMRAVFGEGTGSGSARAGVAAFDPATGERVTTFATEGAVVFRRSGN